jgi:hypothetical protein
VAWPGGPRNEVREGIVESVDLFPTLCELARVPSPNTVDGRSILPELMGEGEGKDRAICEWDFVSPQRFVNAIRTRRHRLVYYSHELGGELYDHDMDPDEMHNRYDDPAYASVRLALFEQLYDEVNSYQRKSDFDTDREIEEAGVRVAGIQRLQLVPRGHHRAVLYFAITGKFSPLYLIWIWPVGDLSAYLIGQIATRSAMKKMNAPLELDKLCMELVGLGSSRNRPPTRDVREEFREMTLKRLQETGAPNLIR